MMVLNELLPDIKVSVEIFMYNMLIKCIYCRNINSYCTRSFWGWIAIYSTNTPTDTIICLKGIFLSFFFHFNNAVCHAPFLKIVIHYLLGLLFFKCSICQVKYKYQVFFPKHPRHRHLIRQAYLPLKSSFGNEYMCYLSN